MPKTLAQILAEISSQLADNTTGNITPAIMRGVTTDITSSARTFLSVLDYGTVGNGIADDSTAIGNALADISSAGGGTLFFPPGNYLMSTNTLIPPSNCIIQGAGRDVTTITNTCTTGGKDTALTVVMTMTGGTNASTWTSTNTTYAINAPTMGASTVTTTVAANAGNFANGNIIMISGDTHGSAFWYPSWYTTVVSANAGTGVITLAETLPLGGSQLTTVQKIVSLPKNIVVRDLTLTVNSNIGGVSGGLMEILGCDNFLAENIKFVNADQLSGAGVAIGAPTRGSGFRYCYAGKLAGPLELFGASQSFIDSCTVLNNYLLIDGGAFDNTIINNHVKDPLGTGGTAYYGISLPDYAQRNIVMGNSVTGIPNGFAGIEVTDTNRANQNNLIIGNTLVGAGGSGGTGQGVLTGNQGIVGNFFSNLQIGVEAVAADASLIADNYYDAENPNGSNISTFSGTGSYRTRQNATLQAAPSGTTAVAVTGNQVYTLTQGTTQNVNTLAGGLPGDEVSIAVQDTKTVFVNSGTLAMKGGANYNPQAANIVLSFICTAASSWIEKSRSA